MKQTNNDSLIKQALKKSIIISLLIIPSVITIFMAFQVKNIFKLTNMIVNPSEPQIVCFETNICAIEVNDTWYRISGVILMDENFPEEYNLKELMAQSLIIPENTTSPKQ